MPTPLESFMIKEIEENGAMPFSQMMDHVLCHPEYGYYQTRDPFGVQGDFTTAPEISQLFGEMIGAWLVDMWEKMGRPRPFHLIELGPGRGTLMSDVLRVGKLSHGFVDAACIHLIENSVVLQETQRNALRAYDVQWHTSIHDIDLDAPVLIFGNEFLDALPIEQLKRTDQGWVKRVLTYTEGRFAHDWQPAEDSLKDLLPPQTVSNEVYEVSPVRTEFIESCCDLINEHSGASLFIDYGHHRSHYGDTLQAMRAHKFVSIFEDLGHSDLTSHVDFEAIERIVYDKGLRATPVIGQGLFLQHLGLSYRVQMLKDHAVKKLETPADTVEVSKSLDEAYHRLCDPAQMGDLFKVICFYKEAPNLVPAGFQR